MESFIDRLYDCEISGIPLGDGERAPDYEESDFYFNKMMDEVEAAYPGDISKFNDIHTLLNEAISVRARREYRRGISFAIRLMSEAIQPSPKSYNDFKRDYNKLFGKGWTL